MGISTRGRQNVFSLQRESKEAHQFTRAYCVNDDTGNIDVLINYVPKYVNNYLKVLFYRQRSLMSPAFKSYKNNKLMTRFSSVDY